MHNWSAFVLGFIKIYSKMCVSLYCSRAVWSRRLRLWEDDTLHLVGGLRIELVVVKGSLQPASTSVPPLPKPFPTSLLLQLPSVAGVLHRASFTRLTSPWRRRAPLKNYNSKTSFPRNFISLRDTCRRATEANGTRIVSCAPATSLCCCCCCSSCVWDGQSDWTVNNKARQTHASSFFFFPFDLRFRLFAQKTRPEEAERTAKGLHCRRAVRADSRRSLAPLNSRTQGEQSVTSTGWVKR